MKLSWKRRWRNRLDRIASGLRGLPDRLRELRESRAICEFVEILDLANDRSSIELALVRVAGKLTDAALVELLLEPGSNEGETGPQATGTPAAQASAKTNTNAKKAASRLIGWPASSQDWPLARIEALGYPLSLGLWCGERRRLALQIYEDPARRSKRRLTPRLVRRLTELCSLAATAERRLLPIKSDRPAVSSAVLQQRTLSRDPAERFIPFPDPNRVSAQNLVHDSTYLNAVLPFAIAQASRHQEPLTVLCVEIDRSVNLPTGIRSTGAHACPSVRRIAEGIARCLRASDVVVHLDDGRIIVVLPDTSSDQTVEVIKVARSGIQAEPNNLAQVAIPHFKIGLASYPADAQDMASLLAFADNSIHHPDPRMADSHKEQREPASFPL